MASKDDDQGDENKINFTHNKLKGLSTTKEEGRLTKWDTKVDGLHARVSYGGTKTFYLRYRINGRQRRFKLGCFPDMSIKQARNTARKNLLKISEGIDPKKENERNQNPTFEKLTEKYWNEYADPKLADSTKKQYRRIIDQRLIPAFGPENPAEITPKQVRELMESVTENAEKSIYSDDDGYKGHRMANCVRKVLNSIYKNTNAVDVESPGRNVQKLEEKGSRKNDLSDEQIETFWNQVQNQDPVIEKYMKILLLSGQRRTETARMRWEDLDGSIWEIPSEETKNNKIHILPLPPLVQNILEDLREINGDKKWVFYSPHNRNDGPIYSFSKVVERIREDCDFSKEDFRLHDLRTTVTTNMAKLGVKSDICKRVLNHSISGVTDRHYDAYEYIPQKREALNKWTKKVAEIVGLDLEPLREDESKRLEEDIDEIEQAIEEVNLGEDSQQEITAQLNTINSQLESNDPSEVIIGECKKNIRHTLEEEVGQEKADELINTS